MGDSGDPPWLLVGTWLTLGVSGDGSACAGKWSGGPPANVGAVRELLDALHPMDLPIIQARGESQ